MTQRNIIKLSKFLAYSLGSYLCLLAFIHDVLFISLYSKVVDTVDQLQLLPWIAGTVQTQKTISIAVYLVLCGATPFFVLYAFYGYKRFWLFYESLPFSFLIPFVLFSLGFLLSSYTVNSIDVLSEMLLAIKAIFLLLIFYIPHEKL